VRIPTIPATHSERRRPRVGAERRWATTKYLSGRIPSEYAIGEGGTNLEARPDGLPVSR
jgi:hypothetical protein